MNESQGSRKGMSRREFVYAGAAGVGGLVVGGLVGYQVAPDEGGAGIKQAGSTEPIKVGGALPLSGVLAGDGQDMLKGLELAVEEINAGGGVLGRELELATADIESDLAPDKITNAVGRLVNEEKVAVVFAGYADYTHSLFKGPSETGVPLLHTNAYSGDAQFVADNFDQYKMVFQTCTTDIQYGQNFGRVLKGWYDSGQFTPSQKTVAIVTSTDPYSVSVAKNFRDEVSSAGWTVVVYEKVTAPLSEWGPVLAKIRDASPAVVMNTDYYVSDLASFTQQFVADPTPSLLYEQYGPAVPEYLELVGDAGNGVVWATNAGITPDDTGQAFIDAFNSKFGNPPGVGGPGLLYDQVYIWRQGASLAGNPEDFEKVVGAIKQDLYRGVLGTYNFRAPDQTSLSYPVETNDPSLGMPLFTYQIQDLTQVLIDPPPYTQGTLQMPPWLA